MNLNQIETQQFILALFKRSDGVRFLLGSGAYEFKEDQLHFAANVMENDVVSVQGNDGYILAGQVRRPATQSFDGYIGTAGTIKSEIENYRREFFSYFRQGYFYTVVYIMADGTAIQRRRGYIVDAPEVRELYQVFPEYHVALNFEDVNYYKYAENASGDEVYSDTANITSKITTTGGLIWDAVGIVWDAVGATWEEGGEGGGTYVTVDSITNVFPTITINGPAYNPKITNVTTGQILNYTGNITSSQKLVIDIQQKTAKLNGTSVISNVSGDWLYLRPGNNRMVYTIDNAEPNTATVEWQEITG